MSNTTVVAIASGKGGVGKTSIAVNVSIALAMKSPKVYLFDADFGLSNVDILLGLEPLYNLSHVIKNQCAFSDIILTGPHGLSVIPGASGIQALSQLKAVEYSALIASFNHTFQDAEYLIIDTAAGVSDQVIHFCKAAHEILIVVHDEPTSLTDAYALIKILNRDYQVNRFRIVVNMSSNFYEAKKIFAKLTNVTDKFLDVVLHFMGWIPEDELLRQALKEQKALILAYPNSPAAQYIRQVAEQISILPKKDFFIEHIVLPRTNVQ